jgi:hypothetical protein
MKELFLKLLRNNLTFYIILIYISFLIIDPVIISNNEYFIIQKTINTFKTLKLNMHNDVDYHNLFINLINFLNF